MLTLPSPLYIFHDKNNPLVFPTVIRVGGRIILAFRKLSVGAPPVQPPVMLTPRGQLFGIPSSMTLVVRTIGSPTLAVRISSPNTETTGGVFARDSGLLVPAPRDPVSEAITMLSTR